MGELHLDIYVERMKREYNTECITGKPQVAFRETIQRESKFSYTHKKQTGGAGQYGRVIGRIEPMEPDAETGKDIAFENQVMSGNVPTQYIPAVEKVRTFYIILTDYGEVRLYQTLRVFMKRWKKALSLETLSLAVALCWKTVHTTQWILQSLRLGLLPLVHSGKHTEGQVLLFWSLS
jgi:Elongation factor G, domain IV/Elongation Factor G, domain III